MSFASLERSKATYTEVSASNGKLMGDRTVKGMRGFFMRSELIYGALTHISNRYQLCQLASKATRKLHKPNTRLQDTTNEVLVRFHQASPIGESNNVKVASEQVSQQRRAA